MTRKATAARPPQQARSRATLARLLDTARAMLNESEWRDLSVTGLCDRAASSVGSFYARFTGKDALLDRLSEDARSELAEVAAWCEADARRRRLPLPSRLRQVTAALFRYTERQAGVLRALAAEGWPLPWSDPGVRTSLATIMGDRHTGHDEVRDALGALLAVCAARAGAAPEPGHPGAEALARMLERYLGG